MRIVLIANSCEFAGAANLASALNDVDGVKVNLLFYSKTPYGFWKDFVCTTRVQLDPEKCISKLLGADWLLIMGCPAVRKFGERFSKLPGWVSRGLPHFHKWLQSQSVASFATGSRWEEERNREKYTDIYNRVSNLVFAGLDKLSRIHLAVPVVPYVPPVVPVEVEKATQVTLCHSPGAKRVDDSKGTSFIVHVFEKICQKYPAVRYQVLSGLSNQECLSAKARAHVFVDQIPSARLRTLYGPGTGGLGKSGVEAMSCGCATLTSGTVASPEPYFPVPPLVLTNESALFGSVESLIRSPRKLRRVQEEQRNWARECASPESVARYVLKMLREFNANHASC